MVYRWLVDVPLRDSADALPVTWFSIEVFNAKGKRTYHNSFVTDLSVMADTVASLAVLAWRTALAAKGATYRFFEHLRTITTYVVFQNWAHLLRSIAEANIQPP